MQKAYKMLTTQMVSNRHNFVSAFPHYIASIENADGTPVARNHYDAASRLSSVSDGTRFATYSYLANSPLVSQIAFTNSGTWRMTTTKQYDFLNRLTSISSAPSGPYTSLSSFAYVYNSANQRTNFVNAASTSVAYTYDPISQLTVATSQSR